MKHSLFILSASTLLFAACTKRGNLTYAESRAVGQYKFEKVVLHNNLRNTNVTQQYNNMILQLNERKEAAIIDQNNNITYLGKFDVVEQTRNTTDDDGNSGSTTDYTLIIDIKTPTRGGMSFHWVGEDASIGPNKIRFRANKAEGNYRFRLDKI